MKQKIKIKKQYGIINKEVLLNKKISANAKGLYVYLCARSGNKGICNPTIPTICNDLGITEVTFHKRKRELINNGIITVEKRGQGLEKRNHYILLKQNNKSYGYVYLDILKDSRIPLKSKAIYGLLASYAGTKFIAYPLAKMIYSILNISRNTYFKALTALKELNYVITKQLHINGRFANCNYYINGEAPREETKYIFKIKTNKKIKPNSTTTKTKGEASTEHKMFESVVKNNTEWNSLVGLYSNNKKAIYLLDNILSVLVNTIYYENKDLIINGTTIISPRLKAIYNKLSYNNIKYVIENILRTVETGVKIKNIREYIRVALYNSFHQLEQNNYNAMRGF